MKQPRKFHAHVGGTLAMASLLFFTTGCSTVKKYSLTHRVWDTSDLRKFSEPAPDPRLALFKVQENHDVLVQYDACGEKSDAIKRRAYYLRLNQTRIVAGKKPRFANPSQAAGLASIPVWQQDSLDTNAPPKLTECAVTAKDGRQFTLHEPVGKETHELPVYPESSGTAMRLALTPLAVAGDTVIAAGAAAVVGIIFLAESHASFTHH